MDEDEDAVMISDCEARESALSEWEQKFIQSIGEQLRAGRSLSPGQKAKLEQIWERVT